MSTPREKAAALAAAAQALTTMPVPLREISEAAYTMSEGGMWHDAVDSVSADQVLQCWRLVEWIKDNGGKLPEGYRL